MFLFFSLDTDIFNGLAWLLRVVEMRDAHAKNKKKKNKYHNGFSFISLLSQDHSKPFQPSHDTHTFKQTLFLLVNVAHSTMT